MAFFKFIFIYLFQNLQLIRILVILKLFFAILSIQLISIYFIRINRLLEYILTIESTINRSRLCLRLTVV